MLRICIVQTHLLVNDSIALDSICMRTSLCKSLAVDLARQVVNKCPLEHRTSHCRHLIFSVWIQVVANALALSAVVHILQGHRKFEGLHEKGRTYHVIIVKGSPARVGMLMPQFALGMQQGCVLCQVLTIHD